MRVCVCGRGEEECEGVCVGGVRRNVRVCVGGVTRSFHFPCRATLN